MKANRKLLQMRYDDDAVSPVIAVILMVAITVVLAATVFVLVSDIGGNKAAAAPAFNLTPDEGQDRLSVESAAQNADWNRLTIRMAQCTGTTAHTVKAGGAVAGTVINTVNTVTAVNAVSGALVANACPATGPAANLALAATPTKMTAGDFIDLCVHNAGAAGATVTNAKVEIRDTIANTVAYTYTFTDITTC